MSSVMELGDDGKPFAYEEYYPFGETSFRAASGVFDGSASRYRYNGKERDEETGLYYYGARYYAAWLGRWTSADPIGARDGPNLFRYCRNAPTVSRDPTGLAQQVSATARASLTLSKLSLDNVSVGPLTLERPTFENVSVALDITTTARAPSGPPASTEGMGFFESLKAGWDQLKRDISTLIDTAKVEGRVGGELSLQAPDFRFSTGIAVTGTGLQGWAKTRGSLSATLDLDRGRASATMAGTLSLGAGLEALPGLTLGDIHADFSVRGTSAFAGSPTMSQLPGTATEALGNLQGAMHVSGRASLVGLPIIGFNASGSVSGADYTLRGGFISPIAMGLFEASRNETSIHSLGLTTLATGVVGNGDLIEPGAAAGYTYFRSTSTYSLLASVGASVTTSLVQPDQGRTTSTSRWDPMVGGLLRLSF
jgi:RHS repeat-associated protein